MRAKISVEARERGSAKAWNGLRGLSVSTGVIEFAEKVAWQAAWVRLSAIDRELVKKCEGKECGSPSSAQVDRLHGATVEWRVVT